MSGLVKVFLVDDHQLFLSGVRAELDGLVDVAGTATDVDAAIEQIRTTEPAVVLVDVHMPGGGGRAVIEAVRRTNPQVKFLALSVSDAAEDVIGIIRAGARGYVTKTIGPVDLAGAVRRVNDGDAVFSPRLAGFVLDAFANESVVSASSDPELDRLTTREARRPAADRTRLHLQGDRPPARDLGQDGRDACLVGAPQAAAVDPPRAHPVGHRPRRRVTVRDGGRRRSGVKHAENLRNCPSCLEPCGVARSASG